MPKINVAIAERTLSAVRGDEPLSPRINQIVDRYLSIIKWQSEGFREEIPDDEWQCLLDAWRPLRSRGLTTSEACDALVAAMGEKWEELEAAFDVPFDVVGRIVLLELLEADLIAAPTAHS